MFSLSSLKNSALPKEKNNNNNENSGSPYFPCTSRRKLVFPRFSPLPSDKELDLFIFSSFKAHSQECPREGELTFHLECQVFQIIEEHFSGYFKVDFTCPSQVPRNYFIHFSTIMESPLLWTTANTKDDQDL